MLKIFFYHILAKSRFQTYFLNNFYPDHSLAIRIILEHIFFKDLLFSCIVEEKNGVVWGQGLDNEGEQDEDKAPVGVGSYPS